MITCGCRFDEDKDDLASTEPLYVDADGVLVERMRSGEQDVIVHHDDLPAKDCTVVDGILVTTPVRTLIDLALEYDEAELERVARQMVTRGLMTYDELRRRLAEPDMASRESARRVRALVRTWDPIPD